MRIILSAALLVCLHQSLHAGGTPEEAFAAMQQAYRKRGVKAVLPHVTRDSQKTLAGGMVATFFGFKKYVHSLKDANPEAIKALDDLMKRQGLDEDKFRPFIQNDKPAQSGEEAITKLLGVAELVKDHPAFIEDVVVTINRIESSFPTIQLLPTGAVVKDVEVSADTAKGTMHYRRGGKDRTDDIFFRREAGSWKIDFLPGIRQAFMRK